MTINCNSPENKPKNTRQLHPAMETHKWKKGQTGNAGGRPKKRPITEIYEELLEDPEVRARIKEAILNRLTSGRMVGAIELKEAADRIEGKVSQPIEGDLTLSLADAIAEARRRAQSAPSNDAAPFRGKEKGNYV